MSRESAQERKDNARLGVREWGGGKQKVSLHNINGRKKKKGGGGVLKLLYHQRICSLRGGGGKRHRRDAWGRGGDIALPGFSGKRKGWGNLFRRKQNLIVIYGREKVRQRKSSSRLGRGGRKKRQLERLLRKEGNSRLPSGDNLRNRGMGWLPGKEKNVCIRRFAEKRGE